MPCTGQEAAELRASYKGKEFIWVYMDPIPPNPRLDGDPKVLCLFSDGDGVLWLDADYVNPDSTSWGGSDEIVFRQPRKVS